MTARPAPPPRRVRRCVHGWMRLVWVDEPAASNGGYWWLRCERCEAKP